MTGRPAAAAVPLFPLTRLPAFEMPRRRVLTRLPVLVFFLGDLAGLLGASGRRFGAPYSRLFCSRTASSSANFGRTATGNIHWACWRLQYCFASAWPMYMAAGHAPLSALKTRLRSPTTIRSGLDATPSVPQPMQVETLATSQMHSLFKRKRKCELSGPKNAHLLRCAVPADPGVGGEGPIPGALNGSYKHFCAASGLRVGRM